MPSFSCSMKMLPTFPLQNGGTPLLYAVHGNHVKCVKMLLGKQVTEPSLGACEHLIFSFPVRGAHLVFGCITLLASAPRFPLSQDCPARGARSHSTPALEAFALPAHIWGHACVLCAQCLPVECCPVI